MIQRVMVMCVVVAGLMHQTHTARALQLGELDGETPVMTLGESASDVQLVSRSVFEAAVDVLTAGSDGAWIELNGSTGTIHSIVRAIGVEGNKDQMIISGVSADYSGYGVPQLGTVFEVRPSYWPGVDWSGNARSIPPYNVFINSDKLAVSMSFQDQPFTRFAVEYDMPTDAPYTLLAIGAASRGTLTFDWYGETTNSFIIATTADLEVSSRWVERAGLAGTVTFVNDAGRPQRWSGSAALVVDGFTGLSVNPVYWTLQGFAGVTFPAGLYAVGGGSWQPGAVNHFVVWQVGDQPFIHYVTATEVE